MHQQSNENNYTPIILPLDYNKSFLEISKQLIANYYQWFLQIKDERLKLLNNYLFKVNERELKEKDLYVIELLLLNSISTHLKSKKQMEQETLTIPDRLKPFAKPDEYYFDKKTISICFDVGIFMGELIIMLDKSINWQQENSDEFADFGQPVLVKKRINSKINPFRVVKNLAGKIYESTYKEGELIEKFTVWKKLYKINSI